ncbi:hypothetical protein [Aequorivita capsosiphonis]|uniref:hypothetical protein n=1 Tax=Aequorivita capsosiphonis TaxID=487317 RepID=UPI000425D633|nr:hypothetical protein [Aequorivita capsosiphonis]
MKNLRTLLAVGFLAVLTSCGTTKQTADASSVSTETNRGRSNQTTERTKTEKSPQFSSERSETSETVRNSETVDNARIQQMYTALDMNKDQISRYENEWKRSTGAWKSKNRNKNMNSFEKTEYQDRIMKNILDESQFEAYQEWARENPITD